MDSSVKPEARHVELVADLVKGAGSKLQQVVGDTKGTRKQRVQASCHPTLPSHTYIHTHMYVPHLCCISCA